MSFYHDSALEDLPGVERDVEAMGRVLSENGDGTPNFEVLPLLSTAERIISADDLLSELDTLLDEVGDNHFLFYFSGHGILSPFGLQLATSEKAGAHDSGVPFDILMHRFNRMEGPVTVILDCCYSGAAGDHIETVSGSKLVMAYIREDVTILASSSRVQESMLDPETLSDYTAAVVRALEGRDDAIPGDEIDALTVHSHARRELQDQTPVVRVFGTSQHCLRRL